MMDTDHLDDHGSRSDAAGLDPSRLVGAACHAAGMGSRGSPWWIFPLGVLAAAAYLMFDLQIWAGTPVWKAVLISSRWAGQYSRRRSASALTRRAWPGGWRLPWSSARACSFWQVSLARPCEPRPRPPRRLHSRLPLPPPRRC